MLVNDDSDRGMFTLRSERFAVFLFEIMCREWDFYEVCDFVLLLLAYAVSGLPTLKLFFEQLESVKSVLMAIWQRQNCPAASTLSRFLRDVGSTALEQLRALFESDLLAHGVRQTQSGGLIDR